MKQLLILFILIFLAQPLTASAYFYRLNSTDTSYVQGSGLDQYDQAKTGVGYNIEPLAAYGYVNGEQNPAVGEVSGLTKSSVKINWQTAYLGRSLIEYGLDSFDQQTALLYWRQGVQNYTLQNLQCGKLYQYRLATYDVAEARNVSEAHQFQTLACQLNILADAKFDLETQDGILELTNETSGRTIKRFDYNYQATIGIPENAMPAHAILNIREAKNETPVSPSISTGQFSLYQKPITISAVETISNNNIKALNLPATIEISYAKTRMNNFAEQSLKLAYYNAELNKWEAVPTIVDGQAGLIRAAITKMGDYRLLASTNGWVPEEIENNKAYKEYGTNQVYYISDNIKHQVSALSVLHSWSLKVGNLQTSSLLYRVPLGAEQKYRDGSLVRVGAATYYFIEDGGKRLIMNKEVFETLGFVDEWAYPVMPEDVVDYPDLSAIIDSTTKLNNVLVKYPNDNKVYLIEDGQKRWIIDSVSFNRNHYRWDRIITIPVLEIYPDGEPVI